MNLISVKTAADIKLNGVGIEFEKNDSAIVGVKITGTDGNFIVIKATNSYSASIAVMIKEPPKMEDKFLLSGTFAGVSIKQTFEDRHEAEAALRKFNDDGDLTITPVQVPLVEDISPVAGTHADDVPF